MSEGDLASIHVTRWGDGAGPRTVLVHGGVQGSRVGGDRHFSTQRRLAADGWQLIVPDRPGHGRSPSPGRPDDAEADGVWLAELLGDGAHLVGHSFGGCVALAAAARRPSAVLSLTLIEPAMLSLSARDPRVGRFLLKLLIATKLSFSAAARARRFAALMHIPPEIRGGSDPQELTAMGRAASRIKIPPAETLRRELAIVKEAGVPSLVVTGGWNAAFEVSSDAVSALGGGDRLVIPSPHHFPHLVSDAFDNALARFVEEAAARSGNKPTAAL